MSANLLCDKNGIKRKNPMIVNQQIKVEDENILGGFKDKCESRFIESNNTESCITKASCKIQKRKRKLKRIMKDVMEE